MIGQNNIFNIRYSKSNQWIGQISSTRGFCDFDHVNSCVRAMCIILDTYRNKHGLGTIRKIITRFAPSSENDTDKYIDFVSNRTHIDPDLSLSSIFGYTLLIEAMAAMETNFITDDYFLDMFNFYVTKYIKL